MIWRGIDIKNLRRRLGWSRSDLARRMLCDLETVQKWESEDLAPDFHQGRLLQLLETQSQALEKTLQMAPVCEKFLDETGQVQVSEHEIPLDK